MGIFFGLYEMKRCGLSLLFSQICVLTTTASMLSACFVASSPQKLPIGAASDGRPAYAPFRPSVAQLAHLLTPHLDGVARVGDALPLPRGFSIVKSYFNGQLQLVLSETYAGRLRPVYGFIGEIKLVWFLTPLLLSFLACGGVSCIFGDGEGTDTPAQLQIICTIPFRFGPTADEENRIFPHARIQDFVSRAVFRVPIQALKVGESVVGYVGPTNGGSKSAQLVSWEPCGLIAPPSLFYVRGYL